MKEVIPEAARGRQAVGRRFLTTLEVMCREKIGDSWVEHAMQIAPNLGIPEVKPAIESIGGRRIQKVSPRSRHSVVQLRLGALLATWAGRRGQVGTEWRCYVAPSGGPWSSLVPDVAYFSFARLPRDLGEAREKPTLAPDIAAEVLSPDDRRSLLDEKIALYFRGGTKLVIVVNPERCKIEMNDRERRSDFELGESARCSVFLDLRIDVSELFVD